MALHYRLGGVYGYRSISGWTTTVAFHMAAVNDKRRAHAGDNAISPLDYIASTEQVITHNGTSTSCSFAVGPPRRTCGDIDEAYLEKRH